MPDYTVTIDKEISFKKDPNAFPPARLKSLNAGTRDPGFLHSEDYESGTSVTNACFLFFASLKITVVPTHSAADARS